MRIAANSCLSCSAGQKIYSHGTHVDEKGNWCRCPFVIAELADIPNVELISVHTTRQSAIRAAGRHNPIIWIGQAPRDLWLVLRNIQRDKCGGTGKGTRE